MVLEASRPGSALALQPARRRAVPALPPPRRDTKRPRGPAVYDETHIVTPDNYELTLFRRAPADGIDVFGRPVLLLHGLMANRYSFGVWPAKSLPGALNDAGRDVWLLEFRGARSSRWLGRGEAPVNLDQKVRLDLPTAIAEIRSRTKARQVDLVGHSLGGLFSYLYAGGPRGQEIGRMVTVCAPGALSRFFGPATALIRRPASALAPLAKKLKGIGAPKLSRVPGPVRHIVAMNGQFRVGGTDARLRRLYFQFAVEDLPGGDLAQLMQWISDGHLSDRAGGAWDARMARVRQPTLVVAAAKDGVVALQDVKTGYERLGAPEKRLHVVGKQSGASRDYAHADVLIGKEARRDVIAPIVDWLSR